MKLNVVLWVQLFVCLIFGVGFIIAPVMMMAGFLVEGEMSPIFTVQTRFYGSMNIAVGLIALLFLRRADEPSRRSLAFGLLSMTSVHMVLFIIFSALNLISSMGWVMTGVTGFLSLGYILYLAKKT
jgi:hypothetical protein